MTFDSLTKFGNNLKLTAKLKVDLKIKETFVVSVT